MPYCSQCGTFVVDQDRFCPTCGTRQHPEGAAPTPPPPAVGPVPPPVTPAAGGPPVSAPPATATTGVLQPHLAAMLCYIPTMGWIASLVFLLLENYRHQRYVRFHAFQGLFLAVLWLLIKSIFFPFHGHMGMPFPFFGFRSLWLLLVIVLQVIGMIKTLSNQEYRIPILGDLAEKSMA